MRTDPKSANNSVSRSQFHQHFTRKFFVQRQIEQLSIVTFQLLYFWRQNIETKCTCKILMKVTHVVSLFSTFGIRAQFHQRSMYSFYARRSRMRKKRQSSQQCHLVLLWPTSVKPALKTLVKLTPAVNFINVLRTAFTHVDPKCAKKTVKSAVSFGTFGTYRRISCT